ncbi:MAG TPA: PEGA domain-containing protein [Candidatus Acidoferrales bacterium]|nr:PEGA domain-containing protein [Candidatus Acidoferrales bacterium]
MQPSRRHCLHASLALLAFVLLAPRTHAEKLTITSSPPGATVEINGAVVGTTPFQADYPGGYFHKSHTAFAARLEHAMVARVSKKGYLSRQITLTDGPFEWVAITGRRRGSYFLLKSDHFAVSMEATAGEDDPALEMSGREGPIPPPSDAGPQPGEDKTASDTSSVTIASDPAHADIFVDEQFVGQTPSTIHLAVGSHHIELKIPGKESWQRNLQVLKDSQLTLHAVLGEGH